MTEISDVNPLPPGWNAKYDSGTGRRYFINYFTRNTSLEDPRANREQNEYIPMQDFSRGQGRTIGPPTMGAPALQYQSQKNAAAETTLEQSVAKISAMFPTVGETHIKTLLIKYLKSVFPVVEETLLLDTLDNSDNNVHRASEQLMTMGFNKRDTPPPRVSLKKCDSAPRPAESPKPPPRMRTVEEKQSMKERLHKKNADIPERVVSIALDSVDYDEEKAEQILEMMQEDDKKRSETTTLKIICEPKDVEVKAVPIDMPAVQATAANATNQQAVPPNSIQTTATNNNHRRCKGKKESPKINKEFSPSESKYHSQLLSKPCGANPNLAKGPNGDILLPDYATWTGPNQDLVQGPDRSLLSARVKAARGPDVSLRKGPLKGLAKGGSLYSRLASGGTHKEPTKAK